MQNAECRMQNERKLSFILHSAFCILHFLRRHWFLLALLAGVSLAGVRPEWLRPLTVHVPPRGVVALALFLMAWGLESRSLWRAALRPLPALWAVLISYGILPALADGSEAVALLVTLLTTATSWLATTAWLTGTTGAAVGVDSAAMMRELLTILVLPVALGQLMRASPPLVRLAQRGRTVLGVVSRLLIFSIIVKAAADVAARLAARTDLPSPMLLLETAGLCVVVHLIALFVGLWGGQVLRFDRPSRIAIAFAGSQKTLPVALLLFETYFKEAHPLAVVPIVFYPLGQLVLDTFIAERLAHRGAAGGDSKHESSRCFRPAQ